MILSRVRSARECNREAPCSLKVLLLLYDVWSPWMGYLACIIHVHLIKEQKRYRIAACSLEVSRQTCQEPLLSITRSSVLSGSRLVLRQTLLSKTPRSTCGTRPEYCTGIYANIGAIVYPMYSHTARRGNHVVSCVCAFRWLRIDRYFAAVV